MADKRIIQQTASSDIYNDDWFIKDSTEEGTTKISPTNLKAYVNSGMVPMSMIATPWVTNMDIGPDQFITHNDVLYQNQSGYIIATTTWSASGLTVISDVGSVLKDTVLDVANGYDVDETYNTGDLVIHANKLYKCKNDSVTGSWNSSKWQQTTLADMLADSGKVQDVKVNGVSVLDANKTAQVKTHIEITQDDYDDLPDTKLTDGILYCISDSEFGASDVPYDNSDSGLEADNVQDAIDEEVDALGDEVTLREELESATKVYGTPKNLPQPIATFTDGANLPMPSLKTTIVPIQSGSGDPSPTNIRPISGWDECKVSDGGTNVFNPQEIDFGTYTDSTNSWYAESAPNYQKAFETTFKANTQYHFSGIATQGVSGKNLRLQVVYTDTTSDNMWESNSTEPLNINFTSASGKTIDFLKFTFGSSGGNVTIKDFQIEIGTSASTYTKFTGLNTYTIPFKDAQGNPIEVFGGECDVVNGGGQPMTYAKIALADITKSKYATYQYGIRTITNFFDSIPSSSLLTGMSNTFVISNSGESYNIDRCSILFTSGNSKTSFLISTQASGLSADASVEEINEWLRSIDAYIVYPLATPSTFHTQPTSIKSLEGTNNVWGDCGNIKDLKYVRNLNITINDLISRVEALEG